MIELMIAVAIIGVLVAVAYPSYTNSLIKGNRGAAKTFLMEVAQKEQAFLLDNRSYFDATTTAEWDAVGIKLPPELTNFYTVSVDVDNTTTPPSFLATATPKAGTRQAKDGSLTIDQTGKKGPPNNVDKW